MNCTEPQSTDDGDSLNIPYTESVKQIDSACQTTQTTNEGESGVFAAFVKFWRIATADKNMTMYGFRRFKTSHLVNLRLMEDQLERLDREVYQAGLKLEVPISKLDRLGLGRSQRDRNAKAASEVMNTENVTRLRILVQEYDDALIRFNQIMQMQTFSLSDDAWHSELRSDLNKWEQSKTRLVRPDLPASRIRSPLEKCLNHLLRVAWRAWTSRRTASSDQDAEQQATLTLHNITYATKCIACFIVAVFAATVLVIPLLVLSDQSSTPKLLEIALFIVIFCFAVSFCSGSSALATMGVTAAYAAVLVVFISNNP